MRVERDDCRTVAAKMIKDSFTARKIFTCNRRSNSIVYAGGEKRWRRVKSDYKAQADGRYS